MILIALTIVFNIKVVGIILVMSLLTIPQVIANQFTNYMHKIIFISIIVALIGTIGGLILSYYFDIPSGATIIFFLVFLFGLAKGFKSLWSIIRY